MGKCGPGLARWGILHRVRVHSPPPVIDGFVIPVRDSRYVPNTLELNVLAAPEAIVTNPAAAVNGTRVEYDLS